MRLQASIYSFWKRSFGRKITISSLVEFCHGIKRGVRPPLLVRRDIFFVVRAASSTKRDFKPAYLWSNLCQKSCSSNM